MTRTVASIVLVAGLCGCAALAPVDAKRYIPAHRPPRVLLTLRDGSTVTLRGPRITADGDTVVGFVVGGNQRPISLADVTATRTMRPAPLRSALLAGGAVLGIAGLLIVVTH